MTGTSGLVLVAERDFVLPGINLKDGDHAPVTFTSHRIPTEGVDPDTGNHVRKFEVYYHGPLGKLACGELDSRNTFHAWPFGAGAEPPDSKSGG